MSEGHRPHLKDLILPAAVPRWLIAVVVSLCLSTVVLSITVLQLVTTQRHLVDCVNTTHVCPVTHPDR